MKLFQLINSMGTELFKKYAFSIRKPKNLQRLYYLDLTNIITQGGQRSDHGVPIVTDGLTGTSYHNPVTIAFYALYLCDSFLQGEQSNLADAFLLQVDWLEKHSQDGAWLYPVSVRRYAVNPGWKSAMAQGLAISVFVRAFKLTGELRYRNDALQAAAVLARPIEEGGCSSFDHRGLPFFEEVAVNPPAHILNGAIFALWGLYDLEELSHDFQSFKDLALMRLLKELPRYDLGYWSRYDLQYEVPASRRYHLLHIAQLEVLYELTEEPVFRYYAEQWRSYSEDPIKRIRAFGKKAWFSMKEATSHQDYE